MNQIEKPLLSPFFWHCLKPTEAESKCKEMSLLEEIRERLSLEFNVHIFQHCHARSRELDFWVLSNSSYSMIQHCPYYVFLNEFLKNAFDIDD